MTIKLISQAQRAELEHCIKILSTVRAEKQFEGVLATADDCITALQAVLSTRGPQATASDIWQHVDKLQADLDFERTQSRVVIAHIERLTTEHAAMLQVLERCALVLSPNSTERKKAVAFYQQHREFGPAHSVYSCRDEIKAIIASVLENKI